MEARDCVSSWDPAQFDNSWQFAQHHSLLEKYICYRVTRVRACVRECGRSGFGIESLDGADRRLRCLSLVTA